MVIDRVMSNFNYVNFHRPSFDRLLAGFVSQVEPYIQPLESQYCKSSSTFKHALNDVQALFL